MCFRGSGRQGRPRLVDDLLERLRLADRQVREDLAVELDAGELQAVHEHRIGHAVLPPAGVDALDPQRAEVALSVAAVTVGVLGSEEHTSELQSLIPISYAVLYLHKKTTSTTTY